MGCGGSVATFTDPIDKAKRFYCKRGGEPPGPRSWLQIAPTLQCPLHATYEVIGAIPVQHASVSLQGYYPPPIEKPNQDAFLVSDLVAGRKWFAVYDGHGHDGHLVAQFARDRLPPALDASLQTEPGGGAPLPDEKVVDLMSRAAIAVDADLAGLAETVDVGDSGTTAVSILFDGGALPVVYVSNIGDSRAIIGSELPGGGGLVAEVSDLREKDAGRGGVAIR